MHCRCDRPDPAIAENPVIDTGQGHDTAAGCRKEDLVRLHEFGKWKWPDFHIHPVRPCHLDDSAPADALKRAGIRRDQPVAADGKDIESGPFGDVAVGIEKDHRLVAIVLGFEQSGGEIAPVIVLYAWVHAGLGNACHRLGDPGCARLRGHFGAHQIDIGNAPAVEMIAAFPRVARARDQRHAARGDHCHIGITQSRCRHHLVKGGTDRGLVHSDIEAQAGP